MTRTGKWAIGLIAVAATGLVLRGGLWLRRHVQVADEKYDTSVAAPTYADTHPRVCVDAAHYNFATPQNRYAPFASLLRNDGYEVISIDEKFAEGALGQCQVLVIANALGARLPVLPSSSNQAFTQSEMEYLERWVRGGGSLFLIADHEPAGAAAAALAAQFGVSMSTGRTLDFVDHDSTSGKPGWIVFSRARGRLGDHAIIRGRSSAELVSKVQSFAGQSLEGKPGYTKLLVLGDSAFDMVERGQPLKPAAGRAQALAFPFGQGRVVVAGEAAMFTAQVTDAGKLRFGMNIPGNDDRQFTLNIVHWLSRVFD
jgi:hypothetical protein